MYSYLIYKNFYLFEKVFDFWKNPGKQTGDRSYDYEEMYKRLCRIHFQSHTMYQLSDRRNPLTFPEFFTKIKAVWLIEKIEEFLIFFILKILVDY